MNSEPYKCSREAELGIMRVHLDNNNSTIKEIKDIIKGIENAVSVIRVIELEAEQQNKEFTYLKSTVNDLNKSLPTLTDDLEKEIAAAKTLLESKLSGLSKTVDDREMIWKEKYNMLRGIIIGVTATITVLSAVAGILLKENAAKIEQSYNYFMQLKTVDALEKLKKVKTGD